MEESYVKQVLTQQKQLLRMAQGRKGQRATGKASRQQLSSQFNSSRTINSEMYHIRTCLIGHAYPPSATLLADLKPIGIADLRLETHHVGRVLIVRTFGHPIRIQSVQNAIEDKNLDVDQIAVYNGDPKAAAIDVLPKDTIFAVKEPFYKSAASGGYLVRVDHASDLIQLQPTHPMVPNELAPRLVELDIDALKHKNTGNAAFKEKKYLSALEAYTKGLDACGEDDDSLRRDLFRNRSIVNTYLQRYEQASKDAVAAFIPNAGDDEQKAKNNAKALYRAGRAFYLSENFSQARSQFEQLLQISPDDEDGKEQLAKTKARLEEAATGKYDFEAMSKSVNSGHKRTDLASFTANVTVRASGKKGRGLFTTKHIKAGELIFVEKAFSVIFESEIGRDTYVIINLTTNTGRLGGEAVLFYNVVQKMRHNPVQAQRVLELFDGGYSPKCIAQVVDGATTIDTFQVAGIVTHNCFGCPNTSSINEIGRKRLDKVSRSVGVWVMASYINHACDANAYRAYLGDCMIVRATKDIAKGQEISISYRNREDDHTMIQEMLEKSWKFKCECSICTADAKTSAADRKERQGLIKEMTAFLQKHKEPSYYSSDRAVVAKAEKLYAKLDATYDKKISADVPRLPLTRLGEWLCIAYGEEGRAQKIIETAQRVLNDSGYRLEYRAGSQTLRIDYTHCSLDVVEVNAAVCAAHAYFSLGKVAMGKQYMAFAKERYQTLHGELRKFEDLYGGLH